MLESVTRCYRMLDDLDMLFAWGLQWRWTSSMVGGFWPDWGDLPSSRCGGPDVNGDKTCQCPGRMLRFRSMFQEKLGECGHVGVTWLILILAFQDFLPFIFCSKDRRLNAKGYVRFSSHRHAATCIQAQAFGPLSLLILGLEVLPFKVKVWLPIFLWQYTKSNIMQDHSWKFRLHLRSEQDAEEGDVIAWWSQSERALRGAYGPNLHSTLASNDGRRWA